MDKAPVRNWDWLTGILLFLLMQVSSARLVITNWAPFLYFAETLAALGTILGLALGASRFGRRVTFWLAVAYTALVVPWQLSGAADNKLLLDRLQHVGKILVVSLGQFSQSKPVTDSLFFVAFVALVMWVLCILAAYEAARKRNLMTGVIPAGAIVLVIQVYANYQPHSSWWIAVYLMVALLLIGRGYYLQHEKTWAERRVYVNPEAWLNILGGLFAAVVVVILIAWIFPTSISSLQSMTDAWTAMTQRMRDRLSNAVTSLNGQSRRIESNFYGTSLPLGLVAAQGDAPVFSVAILKAPDSYLRYYWRGRVYDTYKNGEWSVSPSSALDFQPTSDDLQVTDVQDHSAAQLRFTVQFPAQTLIYAPAEPVWLDRPASVQYTPAQRGLSDVLSWQAKSSIPNGSHYQVRAVMGSPNVEQLRAAANVYPKWVQDRYLQVPDQLRPAIQTLALTVTSGRVTPYDKAVAVTNYLRANLKYQSTLPPAPQGRDPVEWILFDYKRAFCNYYASAEVLMLRSVGVPARLAVGFDQGEYENGTYVVRRHDAHAWPEVFFPGFGWVEFEPTASQLPLVRLDPAASADTSLAGRRVTPPREAEPLPTPQPLTGLPGPSTVPFGETLLARALLIALSIIAVALALYLAYQHRVIGRVPVWLDRGFERTGLTTPRWIQSWLRWNQLEPVEQAFAPVNWSLRSLGKAPPVHATAAERVTTLKALLPLAEEPIDTVAAELETGLFTPGSPDVPKARRAGRQILLHLLRARVTNFLGL